jgi:hypothetical protein
MKNKPFYLLALFLGITTLIFTACDKDFNELGSDIVNSNNYEFTSEKFDVLSFNQSLGPVQTNNLPINALGYYNNPVFGKTKASFVTQLELGTIAPKFYGVTLADIDSVYLYVPYFVKASGTNSDGDTTYKPLDSLLGNAEGKIKLNVYKSNYFLRNLDPTTGLLEQQRYYSNQKSDFDGAHDATRLNGGVASQNDDFQFKNTQIKFYKTEAGITTVRERLAPGIYMDLNKQDFFDDIIKDENQQYLADNNVFKDHFKGLYFQVEDHPSDPNHSALNMINFSQGKIVIVYKGYDVATPTPTPSDVKKRKTFTLNMKGNTVNLLENTYTSTYTNTLANANTTDGDSRLYIKGGEGSMGIIDLFGGFTNDDSPDLNKMRSENWLINEANLVFNIDDTPSGFGINDTSFEPNRIFLYDYTNKRPLIDYYTDNSTNLDPKFNKLVHSGILQKVSVNARGTRYKIRITNHIRNLVKYGGSLVTKDSTNVRLGLVVTESINSVANYKVLNPFPYNIGTNSTFAPAMSIINPLGTVLYGNNSNTDLRLQLEIVYTKPN